MRPSVNKESSSLYTWVLPCSPVITLAVEDVLSEAVATRLVNDYLPGVGVREVIGRQGIGYIRRRMRDLNRIALYENPVLVVADLDRSQDCAANRVARLRESLTVSTPKMLIRIAVLEIESWIMADREGIAGWLRIAANTIPRNPEDVADPKGTLVQLAGRSRSRGLREAIAPLRVLGTHRTGPNYNQAVGEFVSQHWNPEVARLGSPSLDRAIARIAELGAA